VARDQLRGVDHAHVVAVATDDTRDAPVAARGGAVVQLTGAMTRTSLEDLLHRVNNLLATIQLQAEVARLTGTLPAASNALRLIVEAADRTQAEVQRFRAGGQGGNGPGDGVSRAEP
jgi:hypothetical protein